MSHLDSLGHIFWSEVVEMFPSPVANAKEHEYIIDGEAYLEYLG